MNRIKKNLGYQTVYEVLNTCIPLITAPYLARVLGASQLGIFSYTQSIANYFILLAMLGMKNYGARTIAKIKDNRNECRKQFNELFSLQLISSVISIILYFCYCMFFCTDNYMITYIQGLAIFSCIFDINWLFTGMEMFKITVARSTFIRVLTVIAIITLVKSPDDLWIYTSLMVGGTLLGVLILWGYVTSIIGRINISTKGIVKHLKPNLMLFLPLMAMSVFHIMDKTMLGYLSSFEQTGYYYNADKIINIPIGVITGVGAVMLPRITNLIENGKKDEANKLFAISIEGVTVVSIAMVFGIISIIQEFVPFFFGKGYEDCILLTIVLAPVLYIKALSLTMRSEYLIPYSLERLYTLSIIIGAICNFIANLVFIPRYGAMGAVIGTLIAELLSCICQIIFVNKLTPIIKNISCCVPYVVFGFVMLFAVRQLADNVSIAQMLKLIVEMAFGGSIYIICCLLFWKVTKNNLILYFNFSK